MAQLPICLDVIVITRNRSQMLLKLLKTLDESLRFAKKIRLNIFVLVNGPDKLTEDLLRSLDPSSYQFSLKTFVLENETSPAHARNVLLINRISEWVLFLDDDIWVPQQFFQNLETIFINHPEVELISGPNLTDPTSSPKKIIIGRILANPWITAFASNRYRTTSEDIPATESNMMLCNLCVRSSLIRQNEPFRRELVTCEENLFFRELRTEGRFFIHSPKFFVYHERRAEFRNFLKQIYYYGIGRGQISTQAKNASDFVFVLPAFLTLGVLFLALFEPRFFLILGLMGITYSVFQSIKCCKTNQTYFFDVTLLVTCLPLTFGVGIIHGFGLALNEKLKKLSLQIPYRRSAIQTKQVNSNEK